MSHKKKSGKSKPSAKSSGKTSTTKPVNWKKLGERLFFTIALLGIVTYSVAAYMDKLAVEQDLSVIGNGTATVVQIHDPGCRLCQQLKSNLESVKGNYKEDIQFKVANINSKEGREFAGKYRVKHVTLLFFDKRGKRVNTIQGVTSPEDIQAELSKLATR